MLVTELSREQLVELKERYLVLLADEGFFAEVVQRDYDAPSYDDMANADAIVPDEAVFREFEGVNFTSDDFSTSDMTTIQQMYKYCREQIHNFKLHAELALETIDRARCPLRMADSWLADRMEELIGEYCEEHNLNADDYDAEQVFWGGYTEDSE